MKLLTILTLSAGLFSTALSSAAPDTKKPQPSYIEEAPLPKGWPKPGPYNQVTEKSFPAYRAAYTPMSGESFAFWRLFNHIKRNEIPMTSPVEMAVSADDKKLRMESMGFLYQNTNVGKEGLDGKKVEVKNVPKMKVLSYTWQGSKSQQNLKKAKSALDAALIKKEHKTDDFRVLGYNGPGVSNRKKTWEMIAIIKK